MRAFGVFSWSMVLVTACTGGGNLGSSGARAAVERAVSNNASEEALLELQTQVITASFSTRCQVAQSAMSRFHEITSRNARLDSNVVATVREILERLVTAFCNASPDAGVVDAETVPTPVVDTGVVDSGSVPTDTGTPPPPRDVGVVDSGSGGGGSANLWMCGSATCGYCRTGRSFLMGRNIQFTYHDLATQAGTQACWAAVMERGQSRVSMPTFGCRGRGTPIFGWSQQAWDSLIAQCQ